MLLTGNKSRNSLFLGFTFVELILVVLIASALAALSVPRFKNLFEEARLSEACMYMTAAFSYARQNAVFQRNEHRVRFDFQEGRFWVERKTVKDDMPVFERPKGRFAKVYFLPKGIMLKGDKDDVIFYPDGRCDYATVTIANGPLSRTFTTKGARGLIELNDK